MRSDEQKKKTHKSVINEFCDQLFFCPSPSNRRRRPFPLYIHTHSPGDDTHLARCASPDAATNNAYHAECGTFAPSTLPTETGPVRVSRPLTAVQPNTARAALAGGSAGGDAAVVQRSHSFSRSCICIAQSQKGASDILKNSTRSTTATAPETRSTKGVSNRSLSLSPSRLRIRSPPLSISAAVQLTRISFSFHTYTHALHGDRLRKA
jgi:hypothetical protein